MFDIGSSELLLIFIVALVVVGPKDLPRVLYKIGQYVAKGRAMTRHLRAGLDEMVRQAEMEDLEKKWAADNQRIMAKTSGMPAIADASIADAAMAHMEAQDPAALPAPDAAHVAPPAEMHALPAEPVETDGPDKPA
jgi:sec-independent protein translocase protein TatB